VGVPGTGPAHHGLTWMTREPNVACGSVEIDLRRVREGTHSLAVDGRGAPLVVDPESGLSLADWRLEGEISPDGQDHRVRGFLTGTLETVCDRCLTRVGREIRADLDVRVVVADEGARKPEPSPEGVVHVASDATVLDLTDSLRAAVLLEVPIKNVCREDCRGLCPVCGANRNEESCDCRPTANDPRWDALRSAFDSTTRDEPKE